MNEFNFNILTKKIYTLNFIFQYLKDKFLKLLNILYIKNFEIYQIYFILRKKLMSAKFSNIACQKVKENSEYQEVTLFRNPIIVLSTTVVLIYEQIMKLIKFLFTHKPFLMIVFIIFFSSFIDGPHIEVNI